MSGGKTPSYPHIPDATDQDDTVIYCMLSKPQ